MSEIAVVTGALPHLPLVGALEWIAATAATSVEVTVEPGRTSHELTAGGSPAGRIGAAVAASGLRACGLAASAELVLGHPDLPRVVDLADVLGAGFVRVFPPWYESDQPVAKQLADAAGALARLARSGGAARVLIEPGPGTVAPSPELARRLVVECETAGTGVLYDPANMLVEGHLQPAYAVALLGRWLRHVHVKNVVRDQRDNGSGTRYRPLDQGDVDWPLTVRELRIAGYPGIFSIDHLSGTVTSQTLVDDVRALSALIHGPDAEPTGALGRGRDADR